MAGPPDPSEIYGRALVEGERRLDMPVLEQVATGFIAGVTIVFGLVALGVTEGYVGSATESGLADIAGALAFGTGLAFLIAGRTELFTENLFDPVAAAIRRGLPHALIPLMRLWIAILLLNLVGGAVLGAVLAIDGALPSEGVLALNETAEQIAAKSWEATLARSVLAGALVTLLSYLLSASDGVAPRLILAYLVGVVLALGPFDHVVVSALHILLGMWLGGAVGWSDIGANIALAAPANLAGGLMLITLTHTAQERAARRGRQ